MKTPRFANPRTCPDCGTVFYPIDEDRIRCIECHIAIIDHRRAVEGPSKRPTPKPPKPYGGEIVSSGGSRQSGSYDDRLAEGFMWWKGAEK